VERSSPDRSEIISASNTRDECRQAEKHEFLEDRVNRGFEVRSIQVSLHAGERNC
jgi:hypothetical protein